MSIQIEVPFEAMNRPGVARALSDLMASLGQVSLDTQAAPAPAAFSGYLMPKAQPEGGGSHAEQAPPKRKRRPSRAKPKSQQADLSHLPPRERWETYLREVPEATRTFVQLLEEKGELTVDEAVEALGLASPKAMGGLTGAMKRWAPQRGITLPFERRQAADGSRYWVWLGLPEE